MTAKEVNKWLLSNLIFPMIAAIFGGMCFLIYEFMQNDKKHDVALAQILVTQAHIVNNQNDNKAIREINTKRIDRLWNAMKMIHPEAKL